MKKRFYLVLLAFILTLSACGTQSPQTAPEANAIPESHVIPYPENYPTAQDEYGASAFAGALNHADSKYYVIHDFYNMKSEDSLHILSNFETYQQTTEYTCGPSCALMVLNWFGADGYDEMQIADLVEIDTSKGTSVEGMAKFFEGLGWNVDYHADTDYRFGDIEAAKAYFLEQIDAGVPVMVDWEDWAGHWQVVIGLDECGSDDPYDDALILADPYDITDHCQDGYYTMSPMPSPSSVPMPTADLMRP
ncbi:MAG: C39 family peptidase, partial [Oscillibacter sp.]|nr:C39 family peptidase [Oscillibacter sp.]